MTALLARFDDWSDRLSPILVKEVRQMVRAREFNYAFGVALVIGLLVAFLGLADAVTSVGTSGSRVFIALMICLGVLGFVVVPAGTFSTLRAERADQTLDLITQTALTPRRIVFGKLFTQWVKLTTLFAGMAPFIAMSFLLGGIDLLTILISLAVLFMWSMWMSAASLFFSSASQSRMMSVLFFLGMIFFAFWILVGGAPLVFLGRGGIPSVSSVTGLGWALAASTALCFTSMTNLILLAENRLALAIEDRSTALRIGFFVQYLLIIACIVGPFIAGATGYPKADAVDALGILGGLHLAITATFAITEDMTLSRRVFRRIQKSLKRPWLVFRPGGGRGAAWILLQMLVMLGIGWTLASAPSFRWLVAICSYILFFTAIPTVVLRRAFPTRFRSAHLRGAILLFFAIAGFSASIVQYIAQPTLVFNLTLSAYDFLNPFQTLGNWNTVENLGWQYRPMILGVIGLLVYLDLYRMGRREDKRAAAQI
jgi:hypothetical protein